MKLNQKSLVVIAIVLVLLWLVFSNKSSQSKSMYTLQSGDMAPSDLSESNIDLSNSCAMKSGTGLSSSLLPREVATNDDLVNSLQMTFLKDKTF